MKHSHTEKNFKRLERIRGVKAGIPIVIGYLPIAMTFGMLGKSTGVTLTEAFLFSSMVFAGASQFMALNLIALGVGAGEIILATLLMNFRHFLMSASLAAKLQIRDRKKLPLIAFWVTDETFSVATLATGQELTETYLFYLELVSYGAWVLGTVIGYLVGNTLPVLIQTSMGIALYAMFIAILIPSAKKSKTIALLAILSGGLHTLLDYIHLFPKGWNLIVTIVVASALGVVVLKEESTHE